jgi:hypothetical protein
MRLWRTMCDTFLCFISPFCAYYCLKVPGVDLVQMYGRMDGFVFSSLLQAVVRYAGNNALQINVSDLHDIRLSC